MATNHKDITQTAQMLSERLKDNEKNLRKDIGELVKKIVTLTTDGSTITLVDRVVSGWPSSFVEIYTATGGKIYVTTDCGQGHPEPRPRKMSSNKLLASLTYDNLPRLLNYLTSLRKDPFR